MISQVFRVCCSNNRLDTFVKDKRQYTVSYKCLTPHGSSVLKSIDRECVRRDSVGETGNLE